MTATTDTTDQAIGIIGSGNIGGAIARALTTAGHRVVIANSRGPVSLTALVDELGSLATAGTVEQAAQAGDLVIVTIPLKAVESIPSDLLNGRVVIDTNNYYPTRDGQIAELDDETLTTAEYVARHFAGSTVVKAFNHIPAPEIIGHAQSAHTANRRALTVHGDDAAAVERVGTLIDEIGFDALAAGSLAESWRIQRDTPGYGPRLTTVELREKLGQAKRYRDQ
jgi:predicted dinucleotide-binding enzyme